MGARDQKLIETGTRLTQVTEFSGVAQKESRELTAFNHYRRAQKRTRLPLKQRRCPKTSVP